jgi:hypothetical protein
MPISYFKHRLESICAAVGYNYLRPKQIDRFLQKIVEKKPQPEGPQTALFNNKEPEINDSEIVVVAKFLRQFGIFITPEAKKVLWDSILLVSTSQGDVKTAASILRAEVTRSKSSSDGEVIQLEAL